MINFSVILVPLCQEADDGVHQQDEEQAEDEELLDAHLEWRCRDDQGGRGQLLTQCVTIIMCRLTLTLARLIHLLLLLSWWLMLLVRLLSPDWRIRAPEIQRRRDREALWQQQVVWDVRGSWKVLIYQICVDFYRDCIGNATEKYILSLKFCAGTKLKTVMYSCESFNFPKA